MMGTEDVTRESAHRAATDLLASIFPKHFTHGGERIRKAIQQTTAKGEPA
jgi:hypothetical protein